MGLTNAQRQARWRAKREALVRSHPEVLERELLAAAERSDRLSEAERVTLADKLADTAMTYLRRSQVLAAAARRVRTGED